MSVNGTVAPAVSFTQVQASGFLAGQPLPVGLTLRTVLGSGAAADKVNLVGVASLTFVASVSQDIDLTAMLDVLGGTVNLARVKCLILSVDSQTDGASLTMKAGAANGATNIVGLDGVTVYAATAGNPNGAFLILSYPGATAAVVDGTHKVLTLLPSAHAFNASLIVVGCSS